MSNPPKLKDNLQTNVARTLTLTKRGKAYPNQFKPGELNYMYIFADALGAEFSHFASEREEEILKLFQPGEEIQVVRAEGQSEKGRYYYLVWSPKEGAEARAAASPQMRSNTGEQTQQKRQEAYKDEQAWKNISITLQAFTKSWIESGMAKTPEEACNLAKQTYQIHIEDVTFLGS